ncbi:MAG: response regulator [Pseudomonadota bacterium]
MPAARSLKILVVDDQQTMRGMARQCLKKLGVIEVALAGSGEQAMEAMQGAKFDIVISDLNMPGQSGLELAETIKSHPLFGRTPVFLATSGAYQGEVESSENVDRFVAKPFSVADMRTAIEAQLGELN